MRSIGSAVATILRRISKTGQAPSDVVGALWPSLSQVLSREDRDLLACEGLRNRVNDRMSFDRGISGLPMVQVAVGHSAGQTSVLRSVLVSVSYVMASGETKALINLGPDDCLFLASHARQHASGLLRVAAFMDNAREKLLAHGAICIGDLPQEVQRDLEAKWPS